MVRGDIKVVVGVITAGKGIEAATMLAEVLAVLILILELVSAQEQHMFTEMSQSREVDWVRHVANVHI